jgi:hypothetical protein
MVQRPLAHDPFRLLGQAAMHDLTIAYANESFMALIAGVEMRPWVGV